MRGRHSGLADLMDASRDDVLACMAFPKDRWTKICSTNPLERGDREVKRRTKSVGIFPNDAAIVRLVGSMMIETSDEWAAGRRYMSPESRRKEVGQFCQICHVHFIHVSPHPGSS